MAQKVEVHLTVPEDRFLPLERDGRGYHQAVVESVDPGSLYLYRLDGEKERPDPASRFQPRGVHGPSQVLDPSFPWDDASWRGLPLRDFIVYELLFVHDSEFTEEEYKAPKAWGT